MSGKTSFFNYLVKFWLLFISFILLGILFFAGIAWGWFGTMPSFEELENPNSYLASEVISADGVILGTYFIENRTNVSYRNISPDMINALLAIEDIRFEQHSGIDEKALLRVVFGVVTGNKKGGGSTLTQQLAKNLFPRGNLNTFQLVIRKFQEWVTAVKLERYYSKEEIIAMYLNTVFFGNNAYGIKSASATYFHKTPDSLNLQESALMAGVVNAPSRYSPFARVQAATDRRNLVLRQMVKYNYISQSVYDSVSQLPLGVTKFGAGDHNSGSATYFREYLRAEMKKWCASHLKPDGTPFDLYRDGLKIYTTIDSRMQRYAEEAVAEHLAKDLQPSFYDHWKGRENAPFVFDNDDPKAKAEAVIMLAVKRSERYRLAKQSGMSQDSILLSFKQPTEMTVFSWNGPIDTIMTPFDSIRYYKYFLQAGLMSMESSTGYVKAYVGGIDQRFFHYDHVTQGKRQVGSTFKPFLYTLAMQEGEYSPCYKVPNISYSVELDDGTYWTPKNSSDERIGEEVTLKWALANSNNWISAYLIRRFSPESVIKVAHNMGITSDMPAVPAIALGTPDISLYEMVGAMNTFADRGVYVKPIFITKIEDKNGNVLERFVAEKTEAIDEITAYKMIELMKGVVQTGTGIRLRYKYQFNNPIAGKTGTTQNQSDGWFMGITPDLTTGVWVGAEDRSVHFRSITLGQGANMALPIWALYMRKVYNDPSLKVSQGDFQKPLKNVDFELDCESSENDYNKQVLQDEDEF